MNRLWVFHLAFYLQYVIFPCKAAITWHPPWTCWGPLSLDRVKFLGDLTIKKWVQNGRCHKSCHNACFLDLVLEFLSEHFKSESRCDMCMVFLPDCVQTNACSQTPSARWYHSTLERCRYLFVVVIWDDWPMVLCCPGESHDRSTNG